MRSTVILSCEHGGNRIPKRYAAAFAGSAEALASHRGFDAGALEAAKVISKRLRVRLFGATVSRLLVDLNRSLGHPALFSSISKEFGLSQRQAVVRDHYLPHRAAVEDAVARAVHKGSVLHVCVHSFTPELHGEVRNADVGLLYDPQRPGEQRFCALWRATSREVTPEVRVRMNYPYRGTSDGFTTALRRRWPAAKYLGIEIELNQKYVLEGGAPWRNFRRVIAASFVETLRRFV
jgi:predicted N-formylglutamate amidohydrolase